MEKERILPSRSQFKRAVGRDCICSSPLALVHLGNDPRISLDSRVDSRVHPKKVVPRGK